MDEKTGRLPCALVVDAKALYDCLKSEAPQLTGDKRTQIEALVMKEKMTTTGCLLKWMSSEFQLAHGLTKVASMQLMADRKRTHMFTLQSDQNFTAAK